MTWTLIASFLLFTGHTVDVEISKFESKEDCTSIVETIISYNNDLSIYNIGEFQCRCRASPAWCYTTGPKLGGTKN